MVADTVRATPPSFPAIFRSQYFLAAILILVTLLVYLPAFNAGFVWDDDTFLTENPLIHASDGLYRLWFTAEPPDYFPLTSSMLWLEWRLWGDNPAGYHIVSILLHAISAVLLWRLLAALKIPGAWLAGLLFAVHPVNVESVAWITERKNTLPMVFYLLSLRAYLRFDQRACRRSYAIALVAFLLGLLSKTSIVMLPFVLLGYACWQRGKLTRQDFLRSLPFFALSLVFGLVTVWYQTQVAIGPDIVRTDGLASRLAVAGYAVWFYLYKAIVPLNLCFVYPRWSVDPHAFTSWLPLLALVGVFIGLCVYRRPWTRALRFALAYSVVTLLPVLGFIDIFFMKYSLVADHWQYFSIIGIIAFAAAGLGSWLQRGLPRGTRGGNRWRGIVVACLVAGLGILSTRQAQIYANRETLWENTLARNPECWVAYNNLGLVMEDLGRPQEAVPHFEAYLRLKPDHADAHYNLGSARLAAGQLDEARALLEATLRLKPDHARAHSNLGATLAEMGQLHAALGHYQQALQLNPGFAEAHNNWGAALVLLEKPGEAVTHYQQALRIDADYVDAHYNLPMALYGMVQLDESVQHFAETLHIKPDHAEAHNNLGIVFAQSGKIAQALKHFDHALRLNPAYTAAADNARRARALLEE